MNDYREVNFDGLVGLTHHYGGLSLGNIASGANRAQESSPRAAALQGLEKMKALHDRGYEQAVLPPRLRPSVRHLRRWGFSGSREQVIRKAAQEAPALLSAASSASAMWAANAATVAPSCDTEDNKLHLTPANLSSKLHRSIEAEEAYWILSTIFGSEDRFVVHAPLSGGMAMSDEGAANHTRLTADLGQKALHLFVYGRDDDNTKASAPVRFPARQSRLSVETLARSHRLAAGSALFAQQTPAAIDAGVFHHDVIGVGHCDFLFVHEDALVEQMEFLAVLQNRFTARYDQPLRIHEVPGKEIALSDAVESYLFNSQLLDRGEGEFLLVAPGECENHARVRPYLDGVVADSRCPLAEVLYLDLRESMRNGGGPACLRQRIVLAAEERAALRGRVLLDDGLYQELSSWVERHYRESLTPDDLADPGLFDEGVGALHELYRILELPEPEELDES